VRSLKLEPMSSFIGHSIAALTVYNVCQPIPQGKAQIWWIAVLVLLALAPDIDYLIPALHPLVTVTVDPRSQAVCDWVGIACLTGKLQIRLTHSLVGSLFFPGVAILMLRMLSKQSQRLGALGVQAVGAVWSHILLDMLVGVTAIPLLWSFSNVPIRLPFGILPSAGRISLGNFYFYYNLLIEIGVLAPICIGVYWLQHRYQRTLGHTVFPIALILTSITFMTLAYSLQR
jgi:inner membrane protein